MYTYSINLKNSLVVVGRGVYAPSPRDSLSPDKYYRGRGWGAPAALFTHLHECTVCFQHFSVHTTPPARHGHAGVTHLLVQRHCPATEPTFCPRLFLTGGTQASAGVAHL